jgi:hypothetical protein
LPASKQQLERPGQGELSHHEAIVAGDPCRIRVQSSKQHPRQPAHNSADQHPEQRTGHGRRRQAADRLLGRIPPPRWRRLRGSCNRRSFGPLC